MRRRGIRPLTTDEFSCRCRTCTPAAPHISGPKFFALASPSSSHSPKVRFTLPRSHVEKVTLGMNGGVYTALKEKKPVILADQHKFQAEIGYVAARQKAIELAMVVDEDCHELAIDRSPSGVASWNDDRRPPLFWAGSDHPVDCGTVLMYECRHFLRRRL